MEGSSRRAGSARASLKVVLLHGSLDIWVRDAGGLPDKGVLYKKFGDLLGLRIVGSVAGKVPSASMTSDPYVTVQVSAATVARTYVVPNSEDPVWAQNFVVPVGHEAAEVHFAVKDNDVFGGQVIGAAAIPAEQLLCGDRIEGAYPLLDPNGKPCAPGAVLRLSIQYTPVARLTAYHRGVAAGPDSHGVPNAYFPLRRGMRVTLYQDAHVPEGCLPDIRLDNGLQYQHGQCWRDMYTAIIQARRLIYIAGWSVFHTIRLVRDGAKEVPVQILLCPRSAGKRHSWVKQKVVDARGPREPWHDLHSKIDGPAAYDVLKNFEERWLKASKRHGIKKFGKSYDEALLRIERIPDIINISDTLYFSDNDPEAWHVQVFRSIDSNSAKGFPKDPREATRKNLVCGKNVLIDMSIHTAYVNAIRAAQHFIYIENQYFIGSSFDWDSNKDIGANNLVPIEIALKIATKIKVNQRFSAYIVLPMWPEGKPTGHIAQRILYWQNKTMQMMYKIIYRALKEAGLDDVYEPQDYLVFFCLGNREASDSPSASSTADSPQEQARKNRRFMLYVHSKGMIVDDEYVIIGSANINQRSMEGTRDTEIAMGAYQPQYTWANKISAPRGQVYGYRMSLWAEHIGAIEEDFNHPESIECMRRVRHLGEHNWDQFVANEVTEMRGHLLKYPVSVDREGKVKPLPGCTTFPDMGGNICGSVPFTLIHDNLTI
ncbi:phospholipase D beta 1-like isoform X1 [Triticum dicoccoides]|uniref:phospholipase D beta 1-like isoform X1 n=1 Tax=Triticum dicoccoides TaxID=85692 RepID=UPI00188F620C|nr:phospholipase D beta 1-like isoform X1 [Triticum dicoccoides]